MKNLTLICLTLTGVEGFYMITSEIESLPRTGDRMFVYDLFDREYPSDMKFIGLTPTTPLIVSSVDWIFTGNRYRIDVKLVFPGPDASEIFKATFGVDLSFLSELSPTQQETVAGKSRQ